MKITEYKKGTHRESGRVIALGFFDGVHEGHRAILSAAKEESRRLGETFSVFTFPAEDGPPKKPTQLYSTEEKLAIFEHLGVDEVIISSFGEISDTDAEDFVKKTLINDLRCRCAVAGFDFRFGKNASGDAEFLTKILNGSNIPSIIIDEQKNGGEKISTTRIKKLLREGNCEKANELLGFPFTMTARVTSGLGLGKKLGIPTLNNDLKEEFCPLKKGVYRTVTKTPLGVFNSVTNIGECPTFGIRNIHAETHIIDFSGDLYGCEIFIFFLGYLREEKQFKDKESLILQINVDKNRTVKENGDIKWLETGLN